MTRTGVTAVCFAVGLIAGAGLVWPGVAQPPAPYLNSDLDLESRARDLVSRMSVE